MNAKSESSRLLLLLLLLLLAAVVVVALVFLPLLVESRPNRPSPAVMHGMCSVSSQANTGYNWENGRTQKKTASRFSTVALLAQCVAVNRNAYVHWAMQNIDTEPKKKPR